MKFPNDTGLRLYLSSLSIRDGIIATPLNCTIMHLDGKGNTINLWQVYFSEGAYGVQNERTSRFEFKDYEGHAANPVEDQRFIETLSASMDEVIGFVIDEGSGR